MGYSIRIGNAILISDWDNYGDDYPDATWMVARMESPAAPNSDFSGQSNECDSSYGGWDDFAKATGLHQFFFDFEVGKFRAHPGCCKLTPANVNEINAALERYRERHPKAIAARCMCKECLFLGADETVVHIPNADGNLLRLEWLAFWVRLAVNTCERPAIWNC